MKDRRLVLTDDWEIVDEALDAEIQEIEDEIEKVIYQDLRFIGRNWEGNLKMLQRRLDELKRSV
ncbi:coil containing protein [Vibrio phage 1.121.O._10N.286.46.C4]|nr:coil containing protein [Vibrio phage 1.121.O._10N.286.46.C4]